MDKKILIIISVLIMILIGIFISSKISDYDMDIKEKYNKSLKIDNNKELFDYSMKTNIGNAFVFGEFKAIDSIKNNDIKGEYLILNVIKEEYTQHTRVVTSTDSKGKTTTKTETYWTWDKIGDDLLRASKVSFLNVEFDISKFNTPTLEYINTVKHSSKIRYKYYGVPSNTNSTIFTYLADDTIKENTDIYINMDIEKTIDFLDNQNRVLIFWLVWIMLCSGIGYLEYKYL